MAGPPLSDCALADVRSWSSRRPNASRDIGVSLPPEIATLDPRTSKSTGLAVVDATSAVASLDSGLGRQLVGLGSFLLRTESVSSSRIEHVNASRNDFAKALAGIKSSSAAKTTFAAVTALESMIRRAGGSGRIALTDMLEAHRLLMKDDWNEKLYAGRVRDVQNWIGGSDYSPRGAIHVPPPTPLVDPLMDDLPLRQSRGHSSDRPSGYCACAIRIHPPVHRRQRPHRTSLDQRDTPPPTAGEENRGPDSVRHAC